MKYIIFLVSFFSVAINAIDFDKLDNIKHTTTNKTYKANTYNSSNAEHIVENMQGKAIGLEKSVVKFMKSVAKESKSSSSSNGKTTLSCKYSCISDVGSLFYETYRDIGTIKVTGSSYSDAMDKATEIARKTCKKTNDKNGYKMRGDSVSCD